MSDTEQDLPQKDPFVLSEDQEVDDQDSEVPPNDGKETAESEVKTNDDQGDEEYREISEDGWEDILGSGR